MRFSGARSLGIGDQVVFDLTAVQVDGDPLPLRKINRYPLHFGVPSRYPVEHVLQHFMADEFGQVKRLTRSPHIRLRIACLSYELKHGERAQAVKEILQMPFLLVIGALTEWANTRLGKLSSTNVRPEISILNQRARRGRKRR